MSNTLSSEAKAMLAAQLPIIATVTDSKTPDIGPKRSLRIYDDSTLIYNENTGGQHFKNIKAGSKVAISVIDWDALDGYRFVGTPEISTEGPAFDNCVAFAEEKGMKPPKAAVLIHIDEIFTLKSGPSAGTKI